MRRWYPRLTSSSRATMAAAAHARRVRSAPRAVDWLDMRKITILALLVGCSRSVPGSKANEDTRPPPTTASAPAALRAPVDGGPALLVRIHRFGGGPASLDHSLEVLADGSAHLTGHDQLWCDREKKVRTANEADTRFVLDPSTREEIRLLAEHPEVTGFAGASGPARAPEADGVAAEVFLPSHARILVDGVRGVPGRMGRLLDLDRELAARFGAAAVCR
jgi:hypothetical protein